MSFRVKVNPDAPELNIILQILGIQSQLYFDSWEIYTVFSYTS